MRDRAIRDLGGAVWIGTAVFLLAIAAPVQLFAAKCKDKDPNAVVITVDCSACSAETGGSCTIDNKHVDKADIYAAHRAPGKKRVQVCWNVVNAPDGDIVISPLASQPPDVKALFRDKGKAIKFHKSKGSQVSGKVRPGAFDNVVGPQGWVIWNYLVTLNLPNGKTCVADPEICIRIGGSERCST